MDLSDLVDRKVPPEPWAEGTTIPWDDEEFSRRMLKEHLDPGHDLASRRPSLIDQQVDWLHKEVLDGEPTRILDLGCGPGLYAVRLARLGHEVTGIDFSPASLEYARQLSAGSEANCKFISGDLRTTDYPANLGLAMQIFGELNVFRREEAASIVRLCVDSLAPSGKVVFEVDRPETTRSFAEAPAAWRTEKSGLFSDKPHLFLHESFWNEEHKTTVVRYWVIDAESGEVTRHAQTFAAYEANEYIHLLESAGLEDVRLISDYPSESPDNPKRWMLVGSKLDLA